MAGDRSADKSYWAKLCLHLLLVWALVFGFYEIIERTYLQNASLGVLHTLHIFRGTITAFLLAFFGVRGVYRRREAIVVEAKEILATEKLKQDKILAELGAGLIVLGEDYQVIYANAQAQKWFGTKIPGNLCLSEDCALGKEAGLCPARESGLRQGRYSFEEKIETCEGIRHLYITATPLPGSNGTRHGGIIELIQDVTALKEMESRLRQSVASARVGAISSGIAHQLGNPLSAISAAVERLHSLGISKQETYARYVQRIEIETDRSAQIVRALMDLAKRVSKNGHPSQEMPTRVHSALRAAIETVSERHEGSKNFIKLYEADSDLHIRIGSTEIQEVMVNLLENAIESTSQRQTPRISVHAAKDRSSALVMVCDNGPGIEESHREKIFEPFFTTRRTGTGLGLYLCREILESYGGEIRVDNLPAGGARFLIRLPEARMDSVQPSPELSRA